MESLSFKIQSLESSPLDDGTKWKLILSHKQALEEKIKNDPVRKLRKRLISSMNKKGITIEKIKQDYSLNPYPVGRCNLELAVSGRGISKKLTCRLLEFLDSEQNN